MPEPNKTLRVIRCPHCKTVLVEGQDLCCEALQKELNELSGSCGGDLNKLIAVFNQWYEDHKVHGGPDANC